MSVLAGKLVVVSGASRGIGAATAQSLTAAGCRVVGLARSHRPAKSDLRWDLVCDLTEPDDLAQAAAQVVEQWGTPDIVINNAGAFMLRSFEETSVADVEGQLKVNLLAPFALAHTFLPGMKEAGRGLHITVGSVADHQGFPGNAAYAASKWGLRGLHNTLAAEFAGSGVRFSLISPGPTDTAAWDEVDPDNRPGFLPRSAMLRAEDVAEAICFVAGRPQHLTIDLLRIGPVPSPIDDE